MAEVVEKKYAVVVARKFDGRWVRISNKSWRRKADAAKECRVLRHQIDDPSPGLVIVEVFEHWKEPS